jgi:ribosomal protein S18 acetylase RimI-like enzyme
MSLQVGPTLSGQNLVGAKPLEVDRQDTERAYLFSVCVLPTVQRRGLGRRLVEEAKVLAKESGVKHLYVHVELSNIAAEWMYRETGFITEQVESEEIARKLKRPRRQLLWLSL